MAILPARLQLLKLQRVRDKRGDHLNVSVVGMHDFKLARPYMMGRSHGEDVSRLLDGEMMERLGVKSLEHVKVSVPLSHLGYEGVPNLQGAFVLGNSHQIDLPHLMYFSLSDTHPILRLNQEYFGPERQKMFDKNHSTTLYAGDCLLLPYSHEGNRLALRVLPSAR
jgi:hypothetical protein